MQLFTVLFLSVRLKVQEIITDYACFIAFVEVVGKLSYSACYKTQEHHYGLSDSLWNWRQHSDRVLIQKTEFHGMHWLCMNYWGHGWCCEELKIQRTSPIAKRIDDRLERYNTESLSEGLFKISRLIRILVLIMIWLRKVYVTQVETRGKILTTKEGSSSTKYLLITRKVTLGGNLKFFFEASGTGRMMIFWKTVFKKTVWTQLWDLFTPISDHLKELRMTWSSWKTLTITDGRHT